MDELEALKTIDGAFSTMDDAAKTRTLSWLSAKYGVEAPGPIDSKGHEGSASAASGNAKLTMTAKAVATTLGADSGTDLVQAAAAYLSVVAGKETFSRQMMLDAMKSATGFFKPTYRGNLTGYLETLCRKNVLIEVAPETYAIKAAALEQLTQKLQAAL